MVEHRKLQATDSETSQLVHDGAGRSTSAGDRRGSRVPHGERVPREWRLVRHSLRKAWATVAGKPIQAGPELAPVPCQTDGPSKHRGVPTGLVVGGVSGQQVGQHGCGRSQDWEPPPDVVAVGAVWSVAVVGNHSHAGRSGRVVHRELLGDSGVRTERSSASPRLDRSDRRPDR